MFADVPADGRADVGAPETEIAGDLEDGYLERGGADGDVAVVDPGDAFLERDAAAGSVEVVGAERVFRSDDAPSLRPDAYDASPVGWERSTTLRDPDVGVSLTGANHEVEIEDASGELVVYVTGRGHEVRIDGRGADVEVYFVGRDNAVSVGPHVDAAVAADCGVDNGVERDPFPVEALIETSRAEAYGDAFLGRRKVTYQEPASDASWCPNCGADADAIVRRRREDALFLFGRPVYRFERGDGACECEQCCARAGPAATLDESERKNVLR